MAADESRKPRRAAAIVLSLLAPGLGHLAIGYPRRMVAWYSSLVAIVALTILGTLRGAPATTLLTVVAAGMLRIAAAIDTVRLPRPAALPRPPAVVAMVIGFFAFWQLLAGYVRAEVIEAFRIPSGSMFPTLQIGDHMFASKLDHRHGRGDVVVFRYPPDPEIKYVKRIVALGGDRVETRDGELWLNGQPVPRTRTDQACVLEGGEVCVIWREQLNGHEYLVSHYDGAVKSTLAETTVPEGSVYVLGDNRENSSDSRVWGPVKIALIEGKVTGVWWSADDRGTRWDRVNLRIE